MDPDSQHETTDPHLQQPQHETIIPLIAICRKLEKCNVSQLSQWLYNIPIYFSESKSFQVFIKILLKTLCDHHSEIPHNVLDAILLSSPNENALINLDDSITKSSLNEEKEESEPFEPVTILQIPTDLQIVCFNFLLCEELYQVQKTCRSLNISSRNPNSLCDKDIWKSNINYSHHFYSRIKDLRLRNFSVGWNPKWEQSVYILEAWGNVSNSPLCFQNIQQCSLLSSEAIKLLRNNIKHSSLHILSLGYCRFDIQVWKSLIQCVNLTKLTLKRIRYDSMDLQFLRNETSPFKQLTYLETDSPSMRNTKILFPWILSENSCSKTFKLTAQSLPFEPNFNAFPTALGNIAELYLSAGRISHIDSVLDNIVQNASLTSKKYDYFELRLTETEQLQSNVNISFIESMLAVCHSSKLTIDDELYPESLSNNEWFLKVLNLQTHTFDAIEANFRRITEMNLCDDPKSTDYFDDLKNIGFEQISKRVALCTVNDYNQWCKPLLEMNRTVKTEIHYSHVYDWQAIFDSHVYDYGEHQNLSVQDFTKMWEEAQQIWNDNIAPKIDELVTERIQMTIYDQRMQMTIYDDAVDIDWNSCVDV